MSVEALGAVLTHSQSTKNTRAVAVALANRADEAGYLWYSVATIAEKANCERRAVQRALRQLEELGELDIVLNERGGRGRPRVYLLNLPGLTGEVTPDLISRLISSGLLERGTELSPFNSAGKGGPNGAKRATPETPDTSGETSTLEQPKPVSAVQDVGPSTPSEVSQGKEEPIRNRVPTEGQLSQLLADLVAANDPNGLRPEVGEKWLDAERLLVTADGRDSEQAAKLIRWCQLDEFWRGNVKSMPKFRKQYATLYDHARRNKPRGKANDRVRELVDRARKAAGQ